MNLYNMSEHWLGLFGTGLVIIAYIPQITHLMKMHCGDGVSIPAYALWAAASSFLCVYAVIGDEPVFIVLQGYHAAACGLILIFGIKYRTSRCPMHRTADMEVADKVSDGQSKT